MTSPRVVLRVLVTAPPLMAVLLMAVISTGGALSVGPLAPDPPRNLAEAIALSDAATAAWLLQTGADPNAVYRIRPGLLSGDVDMQVRPLAAAAYTADDVMVRVAQRYGARLPEDEARAAACWLAGKGREGIGLMVAPPGWTRDACPPAGARQ